MGSLSKVTSKGRSALISFCSKKYEISKSARVAFPTENCSMIYYIWRLNIQSQAHALPIRHFGTIYYRSLQSGAGNPSQIDPGNPFKGNTAHNDHRALSGPCAKLALQDNRS